MTFDKAIFFRFPVFMKGGRPIIDDRNQEALSRIIDDIHQVNLTRIGILKKSSFSKIIEVIRIYFRLKVSTSEIEQKIGKIDEQTLIFASHSTYGFLLNKIKCYNPNIYTITFFHNIESAVCKENFRKSKNLKNLKNYWLTYFIEKLAVKCSDKIIVLNNRDQKLLSKIYHYNHSFLWPTSLKDRFNPIKKKNSHNNRRLSLLFVGINYPANKQGMAWMIKNIAPYVEADFYIVGAGMDKLNIYTSESNNVFLTGEVDSETLDKYYYQADLFISTLFMGGGMKTKVAEAMMFGLPIVGTSETFMGYEEHIKEIGFCSEQSKEIIAFINKLIFEPSLLQHYSIKARETFIQNYSYESSFSKIQEIMTAP